MTAKPICEKQRVLLMIVIIILEKKSIFEHSVLT